MKELYPYSDIQRPRLSWLDWLLLTIVAGCLCALVALMVTGCSTSGELPTPSGKSQVKLVNIDGANISYLEEGTGKPIVMVHGIPSISHIWERLTDDLSITNRVIVIDLPGFGYSDPPQNNDYTISNYTEMLRSFLETLDIDQPMLLCHDYGATIGLTYALRYPENYRQLVILDIFSQVDLPADPISWQIAKMRIQDEMAVVFGQDDSRRPNPDLRTRSHIPMSDDLIRRYYMSEGNPVKLNRTMYALCRVDYKQDLKYIADNIESIDKKILIIRGTRSRFFPISTGDQIQQAVKNSEVITFSDRGPFQQADAGKRISHIIAEFVGG